MTPLVNMLPVGASILEGIDLKQSWALVRTVMANPGSNPTVALFVYAAAAMLGLIVVLSLMLMLTPSKRRVVKIRRRIGPRPETPEGEEPAEETPAARPAAADVAAAVASARPPRKAPGKLFMALTSPLAVGIMVAVALLGTYAATSTNVYCAETCHGTTDASTSWRDAGHTTCRACHEQGLVGGFFGNSASRLRMVVAQVSGTQPKPGAGAPVASAACLRCHGAIRKGVAETTRGVKVSHAEILSAGLPCTDCHSEAGHSKRAYTASMSKCVTCHNDKTASAKCATCHTKDPVSATFASGESTATLGSGKIVYPAVRAANRDCGGCHDQAKECDTCHGIRMPHSVAFIEGGHARAAAFEAKLACFRCHDPVICGRCHTSFDPRTGVSAHGANWKQEHKASSPDAGCPCHNQRSTRTKPICTLCH